MQDILGMEVGGQALGDFLTLSMLTSVLGSVFAAAVLLVIGLWAGGFVGRRITAISAKSEALDDTLFGFFGNMARYAVYVFTALIVMNTFGIQTTSILAVVASAGLAIGLALQGTLSNVAAGVMLILFRPLKNGDFVAVGGEMGTVKEISLNCTELATANNVQVIIPNAQIWGNTITNFSTYPTRRVEWTFGVGYGSDLKKAEQIILETITNDPRAMVDPAPFIKVGTLNASSVDFLVRVWAQSSDAFAFEKDMNMAVKHALDAAGIDIPFNTTTVIQG